MVPGRARGVWLNTFKFEMEAQKWRERTAPAMVRLIELDEKAQDSGLSEDEIEEHDRLEAITNSHLSQFLKDSK